MSFGVLGESYFFSPESLQCVPYENSLDSKFRDEEGGTSAPKKKVKVTNKSGDRGYRGTEVSLSSAESTHNQTPDQIGLPVRVGVFVNKSETGKTHVVLTRGEFFYNPIYLCPVYFCRDGVGVLYLVSTVYNLNDLTTEWREFDD